MASTKSLIKNHQLFIYFILTFFISWGAIYLLAGPNGFPITQDQAMLMGMAILLGPSLAGIVMTALVSGCSGFRDLFSRLVKWRVRGRWYAIALLTAPLSTAAVVGLLSLFSSAFHPNILQSNDKIKLLISAIVGGLFVAFFEELGWTEFAIPRMKRFRGVLGTGVIIGLIWGAWHFPLFWGVNSFTALLPFALLLAKLFSWLPAYRVLMVWIYDHTQSLFLLILMHTILVATLLTLDPMVTGARLLLFIVVRAAVLWGIVAVFRRFSCR